MTPDAKHMEAAPDANGWMPIETAPRDGTEVLVMVFDHRPPEQRICVAFFAQADDGSARWALMNTMTGWLALTQPVTHWQPLPKPPVEPA